MAIQSKTIYKFNAIFMKIPRFIFKNRKAHLKVHLVYQGTPNNQTILKRVTKLDDSGFIVSKLTTKILIKIVWFWHNYKYTDQGNRKDHRNKLSHILSIDLLIQNQCQGQ